MTSTPVRSRSGRPRPIGPRDPAGPAELLARNTSAFDALLLAAHDGAPWAWQHLYTWLAPAVAGYLRAQGAREVDDLTSETFLGVVRGIARFRGDEGQFRSWVFVIAHRRLQDERRQLGARDPLPRSWNPTRQRSRPPTRRPTRCAGSPPTACAWCVIASHPINATCCCSA